MASISLVETISDVLVCLRDKIQGTIVKKFKFEYKSLGEVCRRWLTLTSH